MRIRGYAPGTPCWVELTSPDPTAAAAFYQGLFGWTVDSGGTFRLGDLAVAGVAPGAPNQPAFWLTYVSTDDVDGTVGLVTANGGHLLAPPTEVGTGRRIAVCADSAGAVFALWQRLGFAGAQLHGEPGAICWNEIATRDEAAAARFYGAVFGWTDRDGELADIEYREWVANGRVVGGMSAMGAEFPPETPPHWRTTFEVDDCAEAVRRAEAGGGRVLAGPAELSVGWYAFIMDPLGAAFVVVELIPELRDTPH